MNVTIHGIIIPIYSHNMGHLQFAFLIWIKVNMETFMIKVLFCRLVENPLVNQIFWLMLMMISMQQGQAQSCHLTAEA